MDEDNWFRTGDVASIDPLGFMRITDRSKDVIKSGGEWISSIDIENAAMSHPEVRSRQGKARKHLHAETTPCICRQEKYLGINIYSML